MTAPELSGEALGLRVEPLNIRCPECRSSRFFILRSSIDAIGKCLDCGVELTPTRSPLVPKVPVK